MEVRASLYGNYDITRYVRGLRVETYVACSVRWVLKTSKKVDYTEGQKG